ncbi:unnamed protein product [Polarella glacialis]|uniref:Uncharacterized protein n=1 Tax=Polarella glacialis TaxID=89957 RepID=A0A813I9T1_POLGL|nr:unnamed protein product [Polarella glacialis]
MQDLRRTRVLFGLLEAHTQVTGDIHLPLLSDFLLAQVVAFAARTSQLKLVSNATHNVGQQNMKLMSASAVGLHWSKGDWRMTTIPAVFCLSKEESAESVTAMLEALKEALLDRFGFDLAEQVSDHYLDGGSGLAAGFAATLPASAERRCLQRIKKQLAKKTKLWKNGNKHKQLQLWVEVSAFLPSNVLSHKFWSYALDSLIKLEEEAMVTYLKGHVLKISDDGFWCASWQSGITQIEPGFSTYVSNSLESFWGEITENPWWLGERRCYCSNQVAQ